MSSAALATFSEMKTVEREKARAMRRDEGRSIKEIAGLLGVSKSSVSLWVRDIELSEEQDDELQARNGLHERQRLARAAMSANARARRIAWQLEGRRRARSLGSRYVAGCMLYWAEGARSRNNIVFVNSDPAMARFFVDFVRDFFGLSGERFRLTCNLFADHEAHQREIEDFWLSTVQLPRSCLCKSTVKPLLAIQPEEAKKQTPLRDVSSCRQQHRDRTNDLRLHSGVRWLRPARVA